MMNLSLPPDWVDRDGERRRLAEALLRQHSLLIWGPSGAGKSALLARVLAEVDSDLVRRCIHVNRCPDSRELLQQICVGLHSVDARVFLDRLRTERIAPPRLGPWLRRQTSGRLRRMVFDASRDARCWIILDDCPPLTSETLRLLDTLIWKCHTPVYLLASGSGPDEFGRASSLFWADEQRLSLGPLPVPAARALIDACIERFCLKGLRLEGFREDVLRLSKRFPGHIVTMCEIAHLPAYHWKDRIKTKLVYVDSLRWDRERSIDRA